MTTTRAAVYLVATCHSIDKEENSDENINSIRIWYVVFIQ